MPLCEGRAIRSGHVEPCPDNRRDESVRNHQLLGNTHCDADGSTLPTTNSLSTSYKDITGVINDEPIGVTVVSHNVDGSTVST